MRNRAAEIPFFHTLLGLLALGLFLCQAPAASAVTDARALASQLSDEAFGLLNSLSSSHGAPSPLLGPVGGFAADSQKLSSALRGGDQATAAATIAALKADAATIDKAADGKTAGFDSGKWHAIRHDLESLAGLIPAAGARTAAESASAPAPAARAPHSEPAAAPNSSAAPEIAASNLAVKIDSANTDPDGRMHLKGYIRGRNIRSAGIYLGQRRLAKLGVAPSQDLRIINFDLTLGHPTPGSVIRVFDSRGRSAQAPIMDAAATPPPASAPETASIGAEPGTPSIGPEPGTPSIGDAAAAPSAAESSGENTAEIPPQAPMPSGPKRRMRSHLRARGPSDIQVRIDDVSPADSLMHSYQISGQIAGSNLSRAGIYVDGRLTQEIPLGGGNGYRVSSFDQTFTMIGSAATIRVYRGKDDYTETSVSLNTDSNLPNPIAANPIAIGPGGVSPYGMGVNANQAAIQITSVQQAAPSLYIVNGVISGHNIASAGLFQNGVLVQPLNLGSGLISGISGLIPGMVRQVPFSARFNPAMGYATVRVFDNSGMIAEQPVAMSATPYGANPYGYGAMNPYNAYPPANPYTRTVPPGPGTSTLPLGPGTVPW